MELLEILFVVLFCIKAQLVRVFTVLIELNRQDHVFYCQKDPDLCTHLTKQQEYLNDELNNNYLKLFLVMLLFIAYWVAKRCLRQR